MPEFDSTLEYRDAEGFPGYKVGNDGSVWSCRTRRYVGISSRWHQLAPGTFSKCGHKNVTLKGRTRNVHTLVLFAFVGPCPKGMECRHLDGDGSNNDVRNLCWGTRKQNASDRHLHGRTARGSRSNRSDLTDQIVKAMRKEYESGLTSYNKLAKRHGLTKHAIACIIRRETWKHI